MWTESWTTGTWQGRHGLFLEEAGLASSSAPVLNVKSGAEYSQHRTSTSAYTYLWHFWDSDILGGFWQQNPLQEKQKDQLPAIGETFEGDIVLRNLTDPSLAHAHLANPDLLWPRGIVEYKFYWTFPQKHQTSVREAMDYITERTPCVTFVPVNSDSINYVTIISSGSKCASELGMKGGRQMLWLNSGCFRNGLIIPVHELLHTLGFGGLYMGFK